MEQIERADYARRMANRGHGARRGVSGDNHAVRASRGGIIDVAGEARAEMNSSPYGVVR